MKDINPVRNSRKVLRSLRKLPQTVTRVHPVRNLISHGIKVIVLDFDNCIMLNEETRRGSEEMKDEAWFEVFPEYNRATLEPLLEQAKHDIAGGVGDRKDIVIRVCQHFGYPEEKIATQVTYRCDRFNELVQEGIKKIGVSQNTKNALAALVLRLPLYVNTATPYDAARESLDALGVTLFFKGIYGRPGTKVGNLKDIIAKESLLPAELLFVDDQPSGWRVAQKIGCKFVGIHTAINTAWHQGTQSFPIIYRLEELLEMI